MSSGVESTVAWPAWEDLAFYAQDPEVIHASVAAQRRAAPVHWYEPGGFWVLSKWEHQRYVMSNPDLFCNRYGFLIGDASDPATVLNQLPAWTREELAQPGLTAAQKRGIIVRGKLSLGDPEIENMAYLDPPDHGAVRRVFMKALRPSLVRGLRDRIVQITDDVLQEIPPGEEVDFVTYAGRIQPTIMTELIGVPRDMREQFVEWAAAHIKAVAINPDWDPEEVARLKRHEEAFRTYVEELIEERRASGATGEDLISVVISSELDGRPVGRKHYFPFVTHFVGGGETTRALLSHLALALAEHPDQRRLLLERPELVPNAVEETLRYYPINWSQCRTATQRVEIGGAVIEKDDFVMLPMPSANRDEDVWENPDTYDVTRSFDRDHLALGHGEHACPGALLTRVDASVILERLLAHFPDWEITSPPTPLVSPFVQGMISLPITFHSAMSQAAQLGGVESLDRPIPWPHPDDARAPGQPPYFDELMAAWVVSAYDDVDAVLRDAEAFSSQWVTGPFRPAAFARVMDLVATDPRAATALTYFHLPFIASDGEVHRREHAIVAKAFTPNRVRELEPTIRALSEELVDAMLDRREVPFMRAFAEPLPVQVIAAGLGLPAERFRDLRRWSDGFQALIGTPEPTPEALDAFLTASAEFTEFVVPLIEQRRREPEGDIISAMVTGDGDGGPLAPQAILAMTASLLLAGNETSAAALSGAVLYLDRTPGLQDRVRAEPSLIPALVEEVLRLTTPAQALFRTAVVDTEVGGQAIEAGQHVLLRLTAGNRDGCRFADPLVPHLDRADKRHLAFGRGIHTCVGAPLARAELRITLETIVQRTGSIAISDRPDAVVATGNAMTAGIGELYVDVTAR